MFRQNSSHNIFILFTIFCAGLGGILYGYDIGVISGALLFVQKTIPMTDAQIGFIVGAVLTGGLVGTLFTGQLADRFGRRKMILVACIIFAIGLINILLSTNFFWLLTARLLLGIGVGVVAVAVPLYLTEIAPPDIRGRSVTIFQLFLTLGILVAYLVDLFFTKTGNWRGMFAVIFIPVSILFFSMLFLPETPRWLLSKQLKEEAINVLTKIRNTKNEVNAEILQIEESLQQTGGTWRALFARNYWLPLFITVTIAICNQFTGINVLLQYAPLIIEKSGLHTQIASMLGTVGIGFVNLCGTILAFFLVDKIGRRALLITGTLGIIIAYVFLGTLPFLISEGEIQAKLSLLGFFIFIIFFAIGPGVVVWLVISELLPTKVRGKAVSLGLFFNSLAASILSTIFLLIRDGLGISGTYYLFAGFTVVYFLVATFLLPETKNKSLEQIQNYYQKLETKV